VILKGISETQKVCNGLNQENISVIVDKVWEFLLEKCEICLPITRETVKFKALEVAMSLKILLQDFKAAVGWE
jgi:hypothetical protein